MRYALRTSPFKLKTNGKGAAYRAPGTWPGRYSDPVWSGDFYDSTPKGFIAARGTTMITFDHKQEQQE